MIFSCIPQLHVMWKCVTFIDLLFKPLSFICVVSSLGSITVLVLLCLRTGFARFTQSVNGVCYTSV